MVGSKNEAGNCFGTQGAWRIPLVHFGSTANSNVSGHENMKWVTINKAAELSGYSPKAIRRKQARGIWLEGDIWVKAPDGRILISIEGIERWAEGQIPRPLRHSWRSK
jgi:hypothetical protein